MDPSFQQFLTDRKLPNPVLKTLRKEDVTNKEILRAMKDSDLEELAKKHKLPMGHVVILRSARDELNTNAATSVPRGDERGEGFEILSHAPQDAGSVEREANQKEANHTRVHPPPDDDDGRKRSKRRLRGNEIRDKYKLPATSDRYSRAKDSRNGASAVPSVSATPSPLPDNTSTPTTGAGGLQAAAQMQELYRRGVQRGQKLSVVEEKSRGLMSDAMDYERMCAELAGNQSRGKKKKKKQKKNESSTVPPPPSAPDTSHSKKTSTYPQDHYQRLSASTHTSPRHHHPSQSHPHTPSSPFQSVGPHSDPIRRQSPHVVPTYGTMKEHRRSVTPALSYTSDDETVHLHYKETVEEKRTPNGRGRRCCPCCSIM